MSVERMVHALLSHSAAMAIKKPARDLWWTVAGARLSNPPVPDDVRSVLFVCLGNICRSPFAALLAERRLAAAQPPLLRQIAFASAGLQTSQAARPPRAACEAARPYGLLLENRRPQLLTRALIDAHDMVIAMEGSQVVQLRADHPDQADRCFLLSMFDPDVRVGYDRYNIADPFGRPLAEFERCYRRIDRAVESLLLSLSDLQSARPSGPDADRPRC